MPAKWNPAPRKRVKGYTKADGTKVKGYTRKRVDPEPKAPRGVSQIEVAGLAVSMFRRKGDDDFLGERSRVALEAVRRELVRVTGGRITDIDSVWRGDVAMPRGMTIARLIERLQDTEPTPMQGGRVHVGVNLRFNGRQLFIPTGGAWLSLPEAAIIGVGDNLVSMILKYLPELGEAEDMDDDESPIDAFARRSAAARKGHETRRKNKAKRSKSAKRGKRK